MVRTLEPFPDARRALSGVLREWAESGKAFVLDAVSALDAPSEGR
jgi:hypothetical protein